MSNPQRPFPDRRKSARKAQALPRSKRRPRLSLESLEDRIAPVADLLYKAVDATPLTLRLSGGALQVVSTATPSQVLASRDLGQISDGATVGGLLLALGVLAMTVGLIRGETARDLRTLTATGASARTRRALAGVTAGVIAFLGAALGTVTALLAGVVWAHSSLVQTFGGVPWSDVGLLVVGMPLIGAAAGWLLGGRAPAAVAWQPLE